MKPVAYIPNSQPESAILGLRMTSWEWTSNSAFQSYSGLQETLRWEKKICAFLRGPVGVLVWDQVQFSRSVVSDSLRPHEPQHTRPPQTHVHWVSDAIQPSHPLPSPSPPALNLSQHQGLFKWVSSSHQVATVSEFQLQPQSFQWTPRTFVQYYRWWQAFQVVLVVKNPPADAGDIRDASSIPGSGRSPRGGHGNPLQYSCLENTQGQRSLVGYSPWGCKESDTAEAT